MKLRLKTSYSQRDSQWSSVLLGNNTSSYTIGTDGCLLTSIANNLNAVGYSETPKTLNEKARNAGAFTNGGWWIWGVLKNLYPDMKDAYASPEYRGIATPDSFFDLMRSKLEEGYMLLVEVDFNPSQFGEQMHWVLAYGYEGDDFLILDPWTGAKTNLSVYGDLHEVVFMFRHYQKKAVKDEDTSCTTKLAETRVLLEKANNELINIQKKLVNANNKITSLKQELESAVKLANSKEIEYDTLKEHYTKLKNAYAVLETEHEDYVERTKETISQMSDATLSRDMTIDRLRKQQFTAQEIIKFISIYLKGGVNNGTTKKA